MFVPSFTNTLKLQCLNQIRAQIQELRVAELPDRPSATCGGSSTLAGESPRSRESRTPPLRACRSTCERSTSWQSSRSTPLAAARLPRRPG